MELLPHAGKAEISWRVHFESPVECAAQCLVRREGVEHGVLLVISIHEFTPDVPGKRLMLSRLASQGCEDGAAQAVVVGIMLVAAAVLVLLDAEGVGEDGRAGAVGEAAQHALAVGVVEILLLVGAVGVPLCQVVEDVVGEGAGRVVGGAAGDVAKGIVAFCYVGFFLRFSSRLRFRSCSSRSAFAAFLYCPNACSAFIFPT